MSTDGSSAGNSSENFERVLSKKDIIALAFGAMIGWGWVVLTGEWIKTAGSLGAILAFVLGGVMILFVGLIYAELTSAMPKCGGGHVFSYRGLGRNASFVCSWAMILGYVSVVAFEAVAFPSVLEYLFSNSYLKGYLYTVAGYDVYANWLIIGSVSSIIITIVNYFAVKPAAFLQGVVTFMIACVGILLFGGSLVNGNVANLNPTFTSGMKGVIGVAVMTPFMYVGFDVIPQAAEEINIPFKKIGGIIALSVLMAVVWYGVIIYSSSVALTPTEVVGSNMVAADAMKKMFNGSNIAAKILIIAGIGGIITSWNSFLMGGSRAIYAMAKSGMLPAFLTKLHPKYKTPTNAIILIGAISTFAPLLGKNMLIWLSNAGGCGIVIAYAIVVLAFMKLRKKEPNMERPYKVKNYKVVGIVGLALTVGMFLMYMPGFPSCLSWPYEWAIILGWTALGAVFYITANRKVNRVELTKYEHEMIGIPDYSKDVRQKTIV
ncbi:APC family permease [Clostridium oceanicum]|uniref:APC family permease n=1 Tax=Clostridium oceanicum TaxID=1543 RepID=A0ABN1JR40_9CLOT